VASLTASRTSGAPLHLPTRTGPRGPPRIQSARPMAMRTNARAPAAAQTAGLRYSGMAFWSLKRFLLGWPAFWASETGSANGGAPGAAPSPPTPLPEGEGSVAPSPPAALPEGEGTSGMRNFSPHFLQRAFFPAFSSLSAYAVEHLGHFT